MFRLFAISVEIYGFVATIARIKLSSTVIRIITRPEQSLSLMSKLSRLKFAIFYMFESTQ